MLNLIMEADVMLPVNAVWIRRDKQAEHDETMLYFCIGPHCMESSPLGQELIYDASKTTGCAKNSP